MCVIAYYADSKCVCADVYEESESGKVRFQCELEVPENWNGKEIPKFILESVHFVDSEKDICKFCRRKRNSRAL